MAHDIQDETNVRGIDWLIEDGFAKNPDWKKRSDVKII
jgi:hypothetical protein